MSSTCRSEKTFIFGLTDSGFFIDENVGKVNPEIICFHYLEKIFSRSKYPKNIILNFE